MTTPNQNKRVLENLILKALESDVSIQSVKTGFGHNMAGCACTVLFKNKKAFSFHDDGWCGDGEHADIHKINDAAYQSLVALVTEKNIAQIMFDHGWSFKERVEEISLNLAISAIVDAFIYKHMIDADLKRIMKRTNKAFIIMNNDKSAYMEFPFKGKPLLSDVRKHPKGLEYLTKLYNAAMASAKEKNMTIINTPVQLKELGLIT